ncbi:hypothetical protein JD844_002413 [Phrynosoma platyrhinos]|uniref:Ig-like domain-containing protein n=1 Tax=Phrynosoma platyrhinos TaxID=52577 RepID=A0ABQ7TBE1_PHRPL|nr:hypothetical protein JD844_002413 [Phrynosoma platyrhinos]
MLRFDQCSYFLSFPESSGQIVVTQTPAFLQKNPGDTVKIQCQASSSVGGNMNFYQMTPGEKPKLLIYYATNRFGGTPDRFSGSGSGTDYTFTINGVLPEDEGDYFCLQYNSFPLHSDTLQYKNQIWNRCLSPLSVQPPCFLNVHESSGQMVTQTPAFIQGNPGDRVTIQCKASSSVACFLSLLPASDGQIVITQTPVFIQANSGDKVIIQCQTSSSMGSYMALYRLLANQKPKLLIYDVTNRFDGTPDRFSGSGSGTDFTFTINGVHPEDEGDYYCGQRQSYPLTVIHFSTKTSSLM